MTNQEQQDLIERMRKDLLKLNVYENRTHPRDLIFIALETLSRLLTWIGRQEANG